MTAEAIAGILEALIEGGVHLLDPEQRKAAVRDAVRAEEARWAAIDRRTATEQLDELARRHHVEREDDGS